MTTFNLALYASLNADPPCFVIPVFTTPLSNQTFAQDLFAGGRIKNFMRFDVDSFVTVQVAPPAIARRVGEAGLVAFWLNENEVLFGTREELQESLKRISVLAQSPFVDVERATFVEDKQQIKVSANFASQLIKEGSGRDNYFVRVLNRVNVLGELRKTELQEEFDDDEIIKLITYLENESDNLLWVKRWREGWAKHSWRLRLCEVARWRIMTSGLGIYEQSILLETRYINFPSSQSLYVWWLDHRSPNHSGWILVWGLLLSPDEPIPASKVISALSSGFADVSVRREQWYLLNAWKDVYETYDGMRDKIVAIARENDSPVFYDDYFIQLIIMTIIKYEPNNNWAIGRLRKWLSQAKGSALWINIFAVFGFNVLDREQFHSVGVQWLRRYGRGTNRWIQIFELVAPYLSQSESWNLRVSWLNKARKDLYSWPEVFESLADDAGVENFKELSEIARQWSFRGRNHRVNSTIEEFAAR